MFLLQTAAVQEGEAGVEGEGRLGLGQTTPGHQVDVNISRGRLQTVVETYQVAGGST